MLKRGTLGLAALASLCAVGARAQGVTIDHTAVGCIVAGQFPKMNACFTPASQVARARIYFRAGGAPYWYFVDMKSQAPCYQGILPKPKASIKKIDYYVEVVDKAFAEARSAEYAPDVVENEGACRKDTPAAPFVSKASVAVGAASGAPAVPVGFAAAGIAGAGGVSTVAVVASVAGAGAATFGVISATGGGSNTTTPGPTNPVTVPGTTPVTVPATTQPPQQTINKPPIGVFTVSPDPAAGPAPLKVKFSMCGSTDPDGDPLAYFFDFGDGSKTPGGCSAAHTYTITPFAAKGASGAGYNARISVTDGQPGHEQGHTFGVQVDCPTPSVTITAPNTKSVSSCPVQIKANASDPLGVDFVDFFAKDYFGTKAIGTVSTPPYNVVFNPGGGGTFTLIAEVHNVCGGTATDQVQTFISCYGFRASTKVGRRVAWTSQLDVPGGRGQVVLNGGGASFPGAGRSMGLGEAAKGDNRIEAQLVTAGAPGTWRFDFSSSGLIEPGSLRVLSGEAAEITADAVVFRLKGTMGERVAFTFRTKD